MEMKLHFFKNFQLLFNLYSPGIFLTIKIVINYLKGLARFTLFLTNKNEKNPNFFRVEIGYL
jgi:hypothetical protein